MKRLLLVAVAVAAAGAIAACHKTGSNAGRDLQNPGQSAPVNTAQDVAAGVSGMATSAVASPTDAAGYVDQAAIADMYEVQAGKIAERRGQTPDVRAFGRMMVTDHTKSTEILKQALAKSGLKIAPPTMLDERRQGMIDNLKAAGDSDFDLAYLHQQLAAHIEALNLHKTYAQKGDNPDLRAAAAKIAPVVRKHLDRVKQIGGAKLTGGAG